MKSVCTVVMLFFLVTTGTCFQVISNPDYALFNTKKGLAHNTVISVFHQKNGLIWATTMDGLSRIDATGIHSYQSQQYRGLTSNFLHGNVELDSTTFLLITRDAGFVTFRPLTNEFTSIQPQAGILPDGRLAFIKATFPLNTDKIFAVFDNQQQVVFRKDGTVLESSQMPVYVEESSVFKLDSKKNQVLVLKGNQVEVLRIQSNGLLEKTSYNFDFHLNSAIGSVKSIEVVDNHLLLITENNGLFLLENYSDGTSFQNKVSLLLKPEEIGFPIKRASYANDVLYVLSDYPEFIRYDMKSKTAIYYQFKQSAESALRELNYINSVVEDDFGSIWLGTWGSGVVQIKPEPTFSSIQHNEKKQVNDHTFNLGILEDVYATVWLLSAPGIVRWYPKLNKTEVIGLHDQNQNTNAISGWHIRESTSGIWVATNQHGVMYISKKDYTNLTVSKKARYFTTESALKSNRIAYTFTDRLGRLWISHHDHGIQVFRSEQDFLNNPKNAELIWFNKGSLNAEQQLPDRSVRTLMSTKNGEVWGGTFSNGIVRLSDSTGVLGVYAPDSTTGLVYSHRDIRNISEDLTGTFWIATYGAGLLMWNRKLKKTEFITTKNGLSNDFTYGILSESNSILWVTTNNGLSRIDLKTNRITIFTEIDGLLSNEFNTGSYHKGKSGTFYVGGINGVSYFNPEKIQVEAKPANTIIVSVKAFNTELLEPQFFRNKQRLSYKSNYVTFYYSSTDLTDPQLNEYAYRLIGLDTTWVEVGNRTVASFSSLPPGRYTFEVKSTTKNATWSEKSSTFYFEIVPALWMTLWFKFTLGFLLLSALIVSIRYVSIQKLRRRLLQFEAEKKLQAERERISRDLHDHIGNQLANISSGIELIKKYHEVNQPEKAGVWYETVKEDVRYTMQQLRETIWTLSKTEITLEEFKERLEVYLQSRATDELVLSAQLITESTGYGSCLQPETSLNLFRIVQEAVQNSIKYANATMIKVDITQKNNLIQLCISDNGTFLKRDDSYEGFGIKNMIARAKEIQAEFSLVHDANGTVITVHFILNPQ